LNSGIAVLPGKAIWLYLLYSSGLNYWDLVDIFFFI
jgi:hypothetical protein